jgi:hydroxyacylglutathione hydrolase
MTGNNTDTLRREHVPRVVTLEMYFQHMKNYNYLVVDPGSRAAVIVDPAWEMDKIDQALIDAEARLHGILLTHSHPDHIHLAAPLAAKYNCPIWMSDAEIRSSGYAANQLVGIDSQPWEVGGLRIQPLATPGHTTGSYCFLIGDNLFTGDTLFAEGCGLCPDTPAAHQLFTSLQQLKEQLAPHTRVFPGHSYGRPPGQPFALLLRENIYLQFADKHAFAAFRLRKRHTALNLFGQ